jgi:hypothetical protein
MSRLNKILLSLTIFLLLAIAGTAVLLLQGAKQEVVVKKTEAIEITESSFIHKDWPLTIDPDFIPGALPITSSSEVEIIESDISSVSSTSSIYSQVSSSASTVSVSASTQASTSSKKGLISSTIVDTSPSQVALVSKI